MQDIGKNSEFLQSEGWRNFQKSVGRKAYFINNQVFSASLITHTLPVVGKYLYIPRGPIFENLKGNEKMAKDRLIAIVNLARRTNSGWVRFDPRSAQDLSFIREAIFQKTEKAPHNMQPREIFVIDISKSEEEIMAVMKSKARYNIRLAQKKGVLIKRGLRHIEDFLRLNKETAVRDGITTHSDQYYRKMIEYLPEGMIEVFAAEYDGKIIAANLVIYCQEIATYAHGASSSEHRDVMAPYLLQWGQIRLGKERGCKRYDFGGVDTYSDKGKIVPEKNSSWYGITRFKLGFSTESKPIKFEGSYDIVVNPRRYSLYRGLQRAKGTFRKIIR